MSDQHTVVTNLRSDRDRFVAFAFAAADALVELDVERNISYAVGAVHWLSGQSAEKLIGTPFIDVVVKEDHRLIRASFATAESQSRFGPVNIRLVGSSGRPQSVALFGSHLPGRANRLFLAMSAHRIAPVTTVSENVDRDPETGLLTKDSFADVAFEALKSGADQDTPYSMTLLNVEGFDELEGRLGDDKAGEFISDITAHLQVHSINGETVGRIDDNQFGLVHDPAVDVSSLEDSIAARAREVDPEGKGVQVESSTVALEGGDVSEEDNARALLYTINKFSEQHDDFTVDALSQGYKMMLDDTRERIAEFKSVIDTGKFDTVFQPIVDLKTRDIHHSEALVRFHGQQNGKSPFELITFAEDVGVIGDFDLAMCRKVIDKIRRAKDNGDILSIAVNLSGRSLESPGFVRAFLDLLKSCDGMREQLMFEVTESAKITDLETTNNILHDLRSRGHHVCLDDFGAGASAFQYLRALDIDFVKIDGIYVREALVKPNGKPFLRAMATLCSDLGIETIGEMVEDEPVAAFLIEAGVRYGQGYLFGKPSPGIVSQKWQPDSGTE